MGIHNIALGTHVLSYSIDSVVCTSHTILIKASRPATHSTQGLPYNIRITLASFTSIIDIHLR